jgi:site-specific DNA-cytosine methylase
MQALGIHVFAGGFTYGVKKQMPVLAQLEVHGFGLETASETFGTECHNSPATKWPRISNQDVQLVYGNPRCTAFSTITGGKNSTIHGPWAKQTCDVHELVDYSVAGDYDFVVWESVQQAYTQGRELLDFLIKERFTLRNYRIAHLLLNAQSFGNAQWRRRYFFVAYKDSYKFNVTAPAFSPYYPVTFDAIAHLRDRETVQMETYGRGDEEYGFDHYALLTEEERAMVRAIPNGWDVNTLAKYRLNELPERLRDKWTLRKSDLPFSVHCMRRLWWMRPFPTIHGSAFRFLHPDGDRPITIGECATAMGWEGRIPRGPLPYAQIAKGIIPKIGEWLAEMVSLSAGHHWGTDDWESTYDDEKKTWVGRDTTGATEKVYDMSRYCGKLFDLERYPTWARRPSHV